MTDAEDCAKQLRRLAAEPDTRDARDKIDTWIDVYRVGGGVRAERGAGSKVAWSRNRKNSRGGRSTSLITADTCRRSRLTASWRHDYSLSLFIRIRYFNFFILAKC
jgi:hypothetical protein